MGGTSEQTEQRRLKVIDLLGQGFTEREIANQLEVAEVTIWKDMQTLRTDPTWFKNYIHDLFQRALNSLDLKDPANARCFFTNMARLVAKTMPSNLNVELKGEARVIMLEGKFVRVGSDGKPILDNSALPGAEPTG